MEIKEKIRAGIKMQEKRKKGLQVVFIRYLVWFCLGAVFLVLFVFAVFSVCAAAGWVRPANWMQIQIEQAEEKIVHTNESLGKLLPEDCSYGVYSEKGEYLYGNFGKEDAKRAFLSMKKGEREDKGGYYRYIKRDNGEVCIVRYYVFAQFSNSSLRQAVPNAESLFFVAFFLLFFIQTGWIAKRFGSYMKKRLEVLNRMTEMIRTENLDFHRKTSDIREIDEILESLFRMKEELKKALEKQWRMEKYKNEQVAALAHDIKTPLTVIQGNAELIAGEAEGELKEYNQFIIEGVTEIREYLDILQETLHYVGSDSGNNAENENNMQEIRLKEFAGRLVRQAGMLASGKGIQVTADYKVNSETALFDGEKLYRAVENVVSNGVEYCPNNGRIHMEFAEMEEPDKIEVKQEEPSLPGGESGRARRELRIRISDSGPGFGRETLVHGTEQFYRGDKSRSGKGHYGMGLFIAKSFAESQGGSLTLGRSVELGGAEVTISVTVKPEG